MTFVVYEEPIEEDYLDKMEGRSKNDILAMFTESEPKIFSKYKI